MRPIVRPRIEGRVTVVLRLPGGQPLAVRRGRNAVLRGGAELLAALFTGAATTPINGVMVGVGDDPPNPPYEQGPTVQRADGTVLLVRPTGTVAATDLTVTAVPGEFTVRVTARAVLPPGNAVDPTDPAQRVEITEASLGVLASDGASLARVYNRILFEPVPKTSAHELALFFEVDFPYGP